MDPLQLQYRQRFSAYGEYRIAVWRILCEDFFQYFVGPDATVLDLGAGWCEFINNIRATKKIAMDLNPETEVRAADDVTVVKHDCVRDWPIPAEHLDVVFTSNFLEHLPSKRDAEAAIRHAYTCLKPGGKIICLGPNIKYARGYWDFWDHYIPISEASLSEVLRLSGFRVELCFDRFLPFSMSHGWNPPQMAVRLYLRMRFAWKFFGKQFLVIASKSQNRTDRSASEL
jgi:SAM-dependent methyltransferase